MNLLILGHSKSKLGQSQFYRGTDRPRPYYCDLLAPDHPLNKAFLWYCDEGGETGVVHDSAKSLNLVELYHDLTPPQEFEIIQVERGNSTAVLRGQFLGFDLSASFNYLLLGWGLELIRNLSKKPDTKLARIKPRIHSLEKQFKPKLNAHGLFEDFETATSCLSSMMDLQNLYNGLWESEGIVFEVVSLGLLENSNAFFNNPAFSEEA